MGRTIALDVIDRLTVASPCDMAWDAMEGDGAVRRCGQCHLDVHDLSAMTTAEIQALLARHGDGVCVRMYRRADGTVITDDCPVGVARLRAAARRSMARLVAALVLLATGLVAAATGERGRLRAATEPFVTVGDLVGAPRPTLPVTPPTPVIMGRVRTPVFGGNGINGSNGINGAAGGP